MLVSRFHLAYLAIFVNHVMAHNWTIKIEDNNLKGIQMTGESFDTCDLSNLNLSRVTENAFANLSNVKTLNLADNRLKELPTLENLSDLESLNLANNNIQSGKFYVGLSHLKTLNISNNPLKFFESGHFFGLTKSANILTQGLNISFITTAMFEAPVAVGSRKPFAERREKEGLYKNVDAKSSDLDNHSDIEVCIENGHLTSVKNLENVGSLLQGCRKIDLKSGTLYLDKMGIKTFKNGWFRLQDQNIISIVLSDNEITQFTKELLNDLPAGIREVHVARNRIEKLEKGIIENRNNIDILDLSDNLISEIGDGALEKLNLLHWLLLDSNRLVNTTFLDSLPSNIQKVSLNHNKITEISAGTFNKFTRFESLSLTGNYIKTISAHGLRGFSTLTDLSLRGNRLQKIELGAFKDLKNLVSLDLTGNNLSSLGEYIFSGTKKMKLLRLESNEIEESVSDLLAKMPKSLEILLLGKNKIKSWVDKSVGRLFNRFEKRKKMFIVPNLLILDLHDNSLEDAEVDFFARLNSLVGLSLAGNKIRLIEKGFTKHLVNILILNLSRNPIKTLENGALFGLSKNYNTIIRVDRVPLELIQGGLFDYV